MQKHGELYPITSKSNPKLWFWAHVAIPATNDGCWLWLGDKYPGGYGRTVAIRFSPTRTPLAHRWAYEQRVGPIPPDLQLDHLCRNRSCVNPEHLEPVTGPENTRRGLHGVLRTHCPQKHEANEVNTFHRPTGGRRCRRCEADAVRAKRRARTAGGS
ncbi:MAG TPA: HNH endonuclease signature motif containing protein [Mycobacterium sp.]|uniref:HNH endonuclease signature motif containing protein n=1 Tax=Mycobacterium sp. TaxID=1785 RepID=UPI002F40EB13